MATTTVGIVFEVFNRGAAGLSSIDRGMTTLGRSLKSLAVTAVGLAGIGSIGYVLQKTAKDIGEIGHASEKLGTTTEGLTALQYSARRTGLATDTVNRSMEAMTRRLSEASRGAGEARYAFAELGLNARQLSKMDSAQVFYSVADAMAQVTNRGDRLRLTYDVFGRGQSEVLDLLEKGSAALTAQAEEGRKLGLVLTQLDVDTVRAANVELAKMRGIMTGVLYRAVIELAPYVEAFAGQITDAATAGEGFGSTGTTAMESVGVAAAKVLDLLSQIERTTTDILKPMASLIWVVDKYREAQRGAGPTAEMLAGPMMTQQAAQERYRVLHPEEPRAFKEEWRGQGWGGHFETMPPQDTAEYERIHRQLRNERRGLLVDQVAGTMGGQPPSGSIAQQPDNVTRTQTFFGEMRKRAEESKARRQMEYIRSQTITIPGVLGPGLMLPRNLFPGGTTAGGAGREGAGDQAESQLTAMSDVLNKLRLESEIRGTNALQRQQALSLDKAAAAVQEDYDKGLRTTVDLTAAERQEIEGLVLKAAQADFNAELEQTTRAMQDEARLAGLTNKERERQTVIQNATNEAFKRGVELTAAQREELTRVVNEMQRARDLADVTFGEGWSQSIEEMQESLLTTAQIAGQLAVQMRDGIVGSLSDAVFRSEDLGKSLERVGLKMLEYWMQEQLWKPIITQGMDLGTTFLKNLGGSIAGGFGGGGGGMTSTGAAAGNYDVPVSRLGNVFGTRGIIPFGRGTVIDRPTLFPFARGTGVMGEAGEEGILPLARDNAGRLGVHAGGGGNPAFGEMLAVLKQIAAKQMQINATIVDRRDLLHRKDMEGREGEQLVMYHTGRNRG